MPRVAVLTIEGCYASCASVYVDGLQAANAHLRQPRGNAGQSFAWRFVSATGGPIAASNGLRIETERCDDAIFDVVVIPAVHYPGFKAYARLLDGLDDSYR